MQRLSVEDILLLGASKPIHLVTGHQEAAYTVNVAGRSFELAWLTVNRLDRAQTTVSIDMSKHPFPRLLDDRVVRLPVEDVFVDTVGDCVGKECGT